MDGDISSTETTEDDAKLAPVAPPANRVTPELLAQMRKANLPKPAGVTWSEWCGPKKLNHRHHRIAYLAASGQTQGRIAREVGISQTRISIVMGSARMKDEIARIQKEFFGQSIEDDFKRISTKGLRYAEEVLDNPQESSKLRYQAAKDFMDRYHGKARETLEVKNNTLRDLFDALDRIGVQPAVDKKPDPIDITPTIEARPVEPKPVAKRDEYAEIDVWVQKNVPKSGGSL